jgi:hypothetical protein
MPPYAITMLVFTSLLLGIRLVSRFKKYGGGLGLDDAFIVAGYLLAVAHAFAAIYSE